MAALQGSQAPRVIWDPPEFQGFKVRKVFLASRELKGIRAIKASPDLKVSQGPLAPQVLTISSKANQDSQALRVPQV